MTNNVTLSTTMLQCRESLRLRTRLKPHQEIYSDGIYRPTSYDLRLVINSSSLIYVHSFYTVLTTSGVLQMFRTS